MTARHVYRGLAGLFLLDDEHTDGLTLPRRYGVDDIPLIIQDKVAKDGVPDDDEKPIWGYLGDHILVNGTYDPRVEVTTSLVRFRILNGSNARMYHLGFADGRAFHVVGTDAGLLTAPVEVDRVALSPGERVEIVVAFQPGKSVVLQSYPGDNEIDEGEFDLVKVVPAAQLATSPKLPSDLPGDPPPTAPRGATRRTFRLNGDSKINGREMAMNRIDVVVPAGAREIWEVDNVVYAHNFHIHEVAFQVLSMDGKKPPAHLRGRKDTVFVAGKTKVTLAVEFGTSTDPASPYMFHCHILRHEDEGMMGQFVIVAPGTEHQVPRQLSGGGDHHG